MKLLRRGALIAVCVGLLAVLTGCSEPNEASWPKDSGAQAVISMAIPTSNPFEANNATPELVWYTAVDIVNNWDVHRDVELNLLRDQNCPTQDVANCVEIWRVPPTVENPRLSGTTPACWPDCAFTSVWGNSTTLFNRGGTDPQVSVIVYPTHWEDDTVMAQIDWRNMLCHEGGHGLGLQHFDSDDDGNPDATGPCVNAVPDRDTDPSDGIGANYDWSALDTTYHQCEFNTGPLSPPGAALQSSEPDSGYASDACTTTADQRSASSEEEPTLNIITTDYEEFVSG